MVDYNPLIKNLREGKRFLLGSHYNPDGDSIGSCIALGIALGSQQAPDQRRNVRRPAQSSPGTYGAKPNVGLIAAGLLQDRRYRNHCIPCVGHVDQFLASVRVFLLTQHLREKQHRKTVAVGITVVAGRVADQAIGAAAADQVVHRPLDVRPVLALGGGRSFAQQGDSG